MAAHSKLIYPACYELVHPWHPLCTTAGLMLLQSTLNAGLQIYTPLILVSRIHNNVLFVSKRPKW